MARMQHLLPLTLVTSGLAAACGDGDAARATADGGGVADGAAILASDATAPDASMPHADAGVDAPVDAAPVPIPPPPSGGALGANVGDGGVTFRVWAPGASGVDVAGDFGAQAVALAAEDGGTFAATVASAQAGQAYHFVVHDGATPLTRTDPRARQVSGTSAVIVDPRTYPWTSPAFTLAPKNAVVVYEMHVGSFGDASPVHGTFATVASRLDWLKDFGVNAIELMPSNDFGGDGGWGYAPTGYFAPQPTYGGPSDLRALVDAAHARGIGVILDVVYNHYDSWSQAPLHCFDGNCPNGSNGVYFFSDPTYASTPWGPRLAYDTPAVSDFVADGAFAWFSEYRVDGLRWDSTCNIRALDGSGSVPGGDAVLVRANDAVHALRPDALMVAEDQKGYAGVTAATSAGGLGFDAQWDGFGPMVDAVTATSDAARNIDAVRDALDWQYNGDPFARVLFNESHDTVGNNGARLPDKIDGANPGAVTARKRALLATAALLTAPAVPMLFMGEEMLATGTFAQTPAPLDWCLAAKNAPIVAFYKDAIRARRNLDGVTAGLLGPHISVFHVNEAAKVLAYRRWDAPGSDVIVVLNFGATSYASYLVGLPAGGTWHVRLNSDAKTYSADFGGASSADVAATSTGRDGLPSSGSVALGSYAAVVLSR
jgi:1,4-alpha-glucan branching enzyme